MKAITICNPYPRHILLGVKPVENRTWATDYRGPLLIHAGKSRDWLVDGDEEEAFAAGDPLVFGALVGRCTLADCLHVEEVLSGRHDGRFPGLSRSADCSGPWCWVLTNAERLPASVPWRGDRGLFDVPDGALQGTAAPIGDKVRHVLHGSQTRDHHCHWPGCNRQVPPARWGCKPHWYQLPADIRQRIWTSYQIGQEATRTPSPEYIAAAKAAQDWIRAQGADAQCGDAGQLNEVQLTLGL